MENPVAKNIKSYRLKHNLTQKQLADLAGLPRASLANMESEAGNPAITAVVKVAKALGVSLKDLVADASEKNSITYVKRNEMPIYRQDDNKFASTLISPVNAPYIRMTNIDMMPGCHTLGTPHPKGSHELFYCIDGVATMVIDTEEIEIHSGDLVYFPGNLPHYYANNSPKPVHAVAVVSSYQKHLSI